MSPHRTPIAASRCSSASFLRGYERKIAGIFYFWLLKVSDCAENMLLDSPFLDDTHSTTQERVNSDGQLIRAVSFGGALTAAITGYFTQFGINS